MFESLWSRTAPPLRDGVCVRGLEDALGAASDTIVIGAGVTGLSSALHLAERGARVAVLERDEPGSGTSGRAGGQIIADFQVPPHMLLRACGAEQGERMLEFVGKAPDLLFELIARHAIACDAERTGWVHATRSARHLKVLEKTVAAWSARGAPVRMLDKAQTALLLGTSAYAGGLEDRRNGTIQPLAYARGRAAAVVNAGGSIHCGVDVRELQRCDGKWRLLTNQGELCASTVVLATNVYTSQLHGVAKRLFGRSYLQAHSVQIATEPLQPAQLETVLPRRHSCADTQHLRLRYFRLDRDNRFVIGGPGWLTPPHSTHAISLRVLEASARRMFPQLRATPFTLRWFARDAVTPDLLPHLYEPCAGLFSAFGYNGRGLALATALGSVLARRVLGESAATLPYPTTPASSAPLNLPAAAKFYMNLALGRRHR